jgi:hypothetical protein
MEGCVLYIAISETTDNYNHNIGIHGYSYENIIKSENKCHPKLHKATKHGYKLTGDVKKDSLEIVNPIEFIDIAAIVHKEAIHDITALLYVLEYLYSIAYNYKSLKTFTVILNSPLLQSIFEENKTVSINKFNAIDDINNIKKLLNQLPNTNLIFHKLDTQIFGYKQAQNMLNLANNNHSDDIISKVPSLNYWKYNDDIHPFINKDTVLLQTLNNNNNYYFINTNEDEDIGKYSNKFSYYLLEMQDTITELELFKDYIADLDFSDNILLSLDISKLLTEDSKRLLNLFGKKAFITKHSYKLFFTIINNMISHIASEVTPARLTVRSQETFQFLESLLYNYSKHNNNSSSYYSLVMDITNYLYNGKKLKKEIAVGYKKYPIEIDYKGNKLTIPLHLGLDLPCRNNLKRLESLKPKIELLIWETSNQALRYACIIHSEGNKGVWMNAYANTIYIK